MDGTAYTLEWQILLTVAARVRPKSSNSSIQERSKSSTME